ncbi:MAG: MFS transporter [Vicinamibacterales bacterium]
MGILRARQYRGIRRPWLDGGSDSVDRVPRRRVLVWTSLSSAIVIAVIPVAAVTGQLSMPLLYVVMCAAGASLVIDEVAFQAIIPRIAGRDRIYEANAWVRTTSAAADVVGPSAAGVLIALLTAPFAIVIDVVSFVSAGVLTALIRVEEPIAPGRGGFQQLRKDVATGLRFVWQHPALRAITMCGGLHNICSNGAIGGLYVL